MKKLYPELIFYACLIMPYISKLDCDTNTTYFSYKTVKFGLFYKDNDMYYDIQTNNPTGFKLYHDAYFYELKKSTLVLLEDTIIPFIKMLEYCDIKIDKKGRIDRKELLNKFNKKTVQNFISGNFNPQGLKLIKNNNYGKEN